MTSTRYLLGLGLLIGLVVGLGCGGEPEAPAPPEAPEEPALRPLPLLAGAVPAPAEARHLPETIEMSPSGRVGTRLVSAGEGELHPRSGDGMHLHYVAWRAADGHNFANTRAGIRPRPTLAFLDDAFPGLREGLELMVEGEVRRMWFPQDPPGSGQPGERPEGLIVFEIELVALFRVPDPPEPLDEPPADAARTPSGLRYVVVEPGEGEAHPDPMMPASIRYAGWRAEDGALFASSYATGRPWVRPPARMIAGLREGVPSMLEGERRIFWVPPDLAYEGREGPQGTLVFDVTLLDFSPSP